MMVFPNRTDARRQLARLVRDLGLDRPVVLGTLRQIRQGFRVLIMKTAQTEVRTECSPSGAPNPGEVGHLRLHPKYRMSVLRLFRLAIQLGSLDGELPGYDNGY
jgi:hypothetical protein